MYYIESFNSDFDFFPLDCHAALGIADGTIPDDKMFASSISSENDKAHLGRLNLRGAWSAAVNDLNQYLGIDLGEDFTVTGIETQGSSDKATWVTKYTLQYRAASDDHPSYHTEIMQGQEQMKVNSLNGYLSIIMIIYTTQPARRDDTTWVNDIINANALWPVELFPSFLPMLAAKLGKLIMRLKKKKLHNNTGRKKGKNRGKQTQVKCLAT